MNYSRHIMTFLSLSLLSFLLFVAGCGDPIKKDFSSYLNELKKANSAIASSPITAEFIRCSEIKNISSKSSFSSAEEQYRLARFINPGLANMVTFNDKIRHDNNAEKKVIQILKCRSDYYSSAANQYGSILPKTSEVEAIHKKLIDSNKSFANAYSSVIQLMSTETIFGVEFDKDGKLKWLMSSSRNEDDAQISKYNDEGTRLNDEYIRELRVMANKFNMISKLDKILNPQSLETTQQPQKIDDQKNTSNSSEVSNVLTYDGTIKVGDKYSSLNCMHESGDLIVLRFDTKSDNGKRILSVCKNKDLCEISANIRWSDNTSEGESASQEGTVEAEIISLKNVKKIDRLPEVVEPE